MSTDTWYLAKHWFQNLYCKSWTLTLTTLQSAFLLRFTCHLLEFAYTEQHRTPVLGCWQRPRAHDPWVTKAPSCQNWHLPLPFTEQVPASSSLRPACAKGRTKTWLCLCCSLQSSASSRTRTTFSHICTCCLFQQSLTSAESSFHIRASPQLHCTSFRTTRPTNQTAVTSSRRQGSIMYAPMQSTVSLFWDTEKKPSGLQQ